jgi:hypothetical protein
MDFGPGQEIRLAFAQGGKPSGQVHPDMQEVDDDHPVSPGDKDHIVLPGIYKIVWAN